MKRYRISEFAELDSTNLHALANIHELSDGDVIQALVQTAGHGRLNRRWISHVPGNLCVSLVLKPLQRPPAELPLAGLSQLLATSVCRALDDWGTRASLKWPNDVLVGERKIAGLLAETVTRHRFEGLVLGIGVNLNLEPELIAAIDQPATSLAACTGRPVNVAAFRDSILGDFFARYDDFLATGFRGIRDEYLSRCPFLGTHIGVRRGGETIRGRAHGITAEGALEIHPPGGQPRIIDLGEIFEVSNH
jgi:BirA family biotin operon repressor/biotin-[acetyl-CoA-carboxylase] ligase